MIPVPAEPFSSPVINTPFPLYRLDGTQTLVHQIALPDYVRFLRDHNPRFFFQQLSTQLAAEGWLVIHLWEDVWRQRPDVVQSRLRALVGESERIPARLTQVRRIDQPTAVQFLTQNHLQVPLAGRYKYGLFLPARYFRVLSDDFRERNVPAGTTELLVAVATFAAARTFANTYRSVELIRFANRLNCTVVGGLDKLLKAFVSDHQPNDVMTYADRDWSDGRSYERLGFERQILTEPQQFWVKPGEWIRHYPHRLPDGLIESQLPDMGYVAVYNAGSIKFVNVYEPQRRSA
ncbi:hypothetical protein [Fibrisoma limi]|uniref:hypothetical protein n=1 Tax=Fibrisoma limi TaxID=663275 RepID=UPI0002FBD526|nr:hypothetical protein [Fibrisoma limi]